MGSQPSLLFGITIHDRRQPRGLVIQSLKAQAAESPTTLICGNGITDHVSSDDQIIGTLILTAVNSSADEGVTPL